ncbi:hypothetical protein C0J52_07319 [Blattella germanica]|nr:hypothetical protein C0J52_07319 [Blattella germanica]
MESQAIQYQELCLAVVFTNWLVQTKVDMEQLTRQLVGTSIFQEEMYTEVLAQYEGVKTPPALTRLHTQQPGPHPEHDSYDW